MARNSDDGTAPDIEARNITGLAVRFSLIGDNTGIVLAEAQAPDENGNLIGDPKEIVQLLSFCRPIVYAN